MLKDENSVLVFEINLYSNKKVNPIESDHRRESK